MQPLSSSRARYAPWAPRPSRPRSHCSALPRAAGGLSAPFPPCEGTGDEGQGYVKVFDGGVWGGRVPFGRLPEISSLPLEPAPKYILLVLQDPPPPPVADP